MVGNVGRVERSIRISLGVIVILAGYLAGLPTWGAVAAYAVGAIALITGTVGFCPAWRVLGINTCTRK